MPHDVLDANSIVEAHLYVLVTPCPVCAHGVREPSAPSGRGDGWVRIIASCENCLASEALDVRHEGPLPQVDCLSLDRPINPEGRRSRILDVGQWLTLAELMLVRADGMPDAVERLWLRYRAGECYEEALRFYGDADELPPESSVMSAATAQGLRRDPGRFRRERLAELRAGLPVRGTLQKGSSASPRRRPWWRLW